MIRSTFRLFPAFVALGCLVSIQTSAHAGLIIDARHTQAYAGSTDNNLYVTLTNTAGSAPVSIGGFSFEIMTSSSDVSFSRVVIGAPMDAVYIFTGNSEFGPDITLDGGGTQTISAADNVQISGSGTTLVGGETLGLGIVHFDVLATALPETLYLTFAGYPSTSFSDADGNNVNVGVSDVADTIQIIRATVPEPASIMMVGLSIWLAVFGYFGVRPRNRCGPGWCPHRLRLIRWPGRFITP